MQNGPLHWLRVFLCGICMGAADLVPGVSGGTIAFITGIYEELLDSIRSINLRSIPLVFSFQFRKLAKEVHWRFLLALLGGMAFSVLSLAQVIAYMLHDPEYRTYLYALFFGLILSSIRYCWGCVPEWHSRHLSAVTLGAILAFICTGPLAKTLVSEKEYDVPVRLEQRYEVPIANLDEGVSRLKRVSESQLSGMLSKGLITEESSVLSHETRLVGPVQDFLSGHFSWKTELWFFFCGMLGISAMLLPGISGSYLLNILGVYGIFIGAIADFTQALAVFSFDGHAFSVLFSVGMGIIVGALTFARGIAWVFRYYHDSAISLLTGFMAGAAWVIWPFWTYQWVLNPLKLHKGPQLETVRMSFPSLLQLETFIALAFVVIGFFTVVVFEKLAEKKD